MQLIISTTGFSIYFFVTEYVDAIKNQKNVRSKKFAQPTMIVGQRAIVWPVFK